MDAVTLAVTAQGFDAAAAWEATRTRWKQKKRGSTPSDDSTLCPTLFSSISSRWGERKRKRERKPLTAEDKAFADAVDASREDARLPSPRPKRRRLFAVQCSSHVVVDGGVVVNEGTYRYGFQLGGADVHEGNPFKTFPTEGGRPAFWGSGPFPERPGLVSATVTGRAPFKRDPRVEY